jgi:hypothetical protein
MTDEQIAGLAAVGLAGVEVFHPDHTDSERTRLRALAADLGLLASGGSDDHGGLTGNRIGCETAADGVCAALISMTSGARVMRAGDGCGKKGGESGPRGRNRSDERTD